MVDYDEREQRLIELSLTLQSNADAASAVEAALAAGASPEETIAAAAVLDRQRDTGTAAQDAVLAQLKDQPLGPWTSRVDREVRGHLTQVARRQGNSNSTITMVLCHSLGTSHRMWEPLVAALPEDIDVLAYDLRNHGPERQRVTEYSIPIAAEDLRTLLDDEGVGAIYLAGISMGGAVAQEFAAQFPGRIVGLSLMACRGKGGATGEHRAAAGEAGGLASQLGVTLSRWFSPEYLAENGPWVRFVRQRLLGWTVEAWARGWRGLGQSNTIGRLANFPAPTLCIAGSDDSSSPPAVLQSLVDVIPNAELAVIPGGPHLFPIEQPEPVATLLGDHYREAIASAR